MWFKKEGFGLRSEHLLRVPRELESAYFTHSCFQLHGGHIVCAQLKMVEVRLPGAACSVIAIELVRDYFFSQGWTLKPREPTSPSQSSELLGGSPEHLTSCEMGMSQKGLILETPVNPLFGPGSAPENKETCWHAFSTLR